MPTAEDQAAHKAHICKLLATLDDEAFAWLALAMLPKAMTRGGGVQVWPDGLGGFRDREKIEEIRSTCDKYVKASG